VIVARLLVLLLVAVVGTLVVVTRDTLHQALVFGLYGLLLALVFLLYAAPEAALAQAVVSGLVVPLLVLLALADLRGRSS
jgi:energy-converting hydrogenase B subunit D